MNYHASYKGTGLTGIVNLDKQVQIPSVADNTKVAGHTILRQVLYSSYFVTKGCPFFVDIHQKHGLVDVDMVIPKTKEAVQVIEEMDKKIPAYLVHSLPMESDTSTAMDAKVIKELVW